MIIVGAKGFAKEVLQIFHQKGDLENLYFFDDVNEYLEPFLYKKFKIIQSIKEVKTIFQEIDNRFVLGIGNPLNRYKLSCKFKEIGGFLSSIISPLANIGNYNNEIKAGSNIMTGTVLTNDIIIEEGVLINLNCTIGHDSYIGRYSELCPGVHISGNCKIGELSFIGTGSVLLPGLEIGNNVIIGAGSVVTKNTGDNCLVIGVPAEKRKDLKKLEI